jgi:hypothetical protein
MNSNVISTMLTLFIISSLHTSNCKTYTDYLYGDSFVLTVGCIISASELSCISQYKVMHSGWKVTVQL